jgi:erythritol transport system substrate-binding protein
VIRAALAVAVLAALGTGCGRRANERPLIVVMTPSHENPFFKAESNAAAERARALGFDTLELAHDDDVAKQDRLVDTAIARGAAAIILDNADAAASVSALRRAREAGIPSFLVDRAIARDGVAVAQIIADGYEGARLGAQELVRRLGGEGDYVELVGKESDTNARLRSQGFADVLDKVPGMRRVARVTANWSQTEAFQKMETVLQKHRDVKGVIAGNDTMALGAAAALKAAGLSGVVIVGFDGSPDALAAIRRGELAATILQPAAQLAALAAEQAHAYMSRGATGQPERQLIPCELVTAENVDEFGLFARRRAP